MPTDSLNSVDAVIRDAIRPAGVTASDSSLSVNASGSALNSQVAQTIDSHQVWIQQQSTPAAIQSHTEWLQSHVRDLQVSLNAVPNSPSASIASLVDQFFEIDEFVENLSLLAHGKSNQTHVQAFVTLMACWKAENSSVDAIRASIASGAASSSANNGATASPMPSSSIFKLERAKSGDRTESFALPNSLPSPSHKSNDSGDAKHASSKIHSSDNAFVASIAKQARRVISSHFIELLGTAAASTTSSPLSPSQEHQIFDVLSHVLSLPALALELQRLKHEQWNIQAMLSSVPPTTPSLEELKVIGEKVCVSLEKDCAMISETFAPLCAIYITLNPVSKFNLNDKPAPPPLFTIVAPEKKPATSRRTTRDTVNNVVSSPNPNAHRGSLTVPGAGAGILIPPSPISSGSAGGSNNVAPLSPLSIASPSNIKPLLPPAPHKHPFSMWSVLRSVYVLPICELARRWLQAQGTTLEATVALVQWMSQRFLPRIHAAAAQFVTKGAAPSLLADPSQTLSAEELSAATSLPLPVLSFSNDLIAGLSDSLYDDLLSKLDRTFANQLKFDSIPISGAGSGVSEYQGGGEDIISSRRGSKSLGAGGITLSTDAAISVPAPIRTPHHLPSHLNLSNSSLASLAPQKELIPFSPAAPLPNPGAHPFLTNLTPLQQSERDYQRAQEWKVGRTVPWNSDQANARYEVIKLQLAESGEMGSALLQSLPQTLPQGYYCRLDVPVKSHTSADFSLPARAWLLPLPTLTRDEEPPLVLHSVCEVIDTLGLILPLLSTPGAAFQSLHERFLIRFRSLLTKFLDNLARRVASAPRGASIKHAALVASSVLALKAHLVAMENILVHGAASFANVNSTLFPQPTVVDSLDLSGFFAEFEFSSRKAPTGSPTLSPSDSGASLHRSTSITAGKRTLAPLQGAPTTTAATAASPLKPLGSSSSNPNLLGQMPLSTTSTISAASASASSASASVSTPSDALQSANQQLRGLQANATLIPLSELLSRLTASSNNANPDRSVDASNSPSKLFSAPQSSDATLSSTQTSFLRCEGLFRSVMDSLDQFLLRCIDAQILGSIHATIYDTLLPNIAAFEWSKKRDLPPILMKKIVKPSPALFHVKTFLEGLICDAQSYLPPVVARHISLQALLHCSLGVKECLLSITPSRFHSRQYFVDLCAAIAVFRSFVQAFEKQLKDVPTSVADPLLVASSPQFLLQQINIALVELVAAVVICHPSLLPFKGFAQVWSNWQSAWKQSSSSAASPPADIDLSSIASQCGTLWNCEPVDLAAINSSKLLANFFVWPALQSNAADAPAPTLTQDLTLPAREPISFLSSADSKGSSVFVSVLPPAALIRVAALRHELREEDYPELESEIEIAAMEARASVKTVASQHEVTRI